MALSILDGTQTATTLSTILSSGQHITAHTVVSLGTQAITDIVNATSAGLTNTQLRANAVTIAGTVTANIGGIANSVTLPVRLIAERTGGAPTGEDTLLTCNSSGMLLIDAQSAGTSVLGFDGNAFVQVKPVSGSSVTIGNSVTIGSLPAISGTVTANAGQVVVDQGGDPVDPSNPFPIFGTVDITALPAGTNRIGVVTIGAGTVTLGAGTAQIGSVTASISGTVPVSISSVTVGNSVTIGSLPAISGTVTANGGDGTFLVGGLRSGGKTALQLDTGTGYLQTKVESLPSLVAGTAQIGSVTASISNSVTIASLPAISGTVTANTFALQGTAVTTSNFTSTTASTVLANFNATREVLTIFNEGAGNLHICAGATCTTIAYQVRLSAGDYYEVPNHQTSITHSAVFATAGTARVTQIS
jgi:hypothetical protein